MKDVQLEDVDCLLRALQLMSPRQRNFFLRTMNKDQMRILEVAFFNLATNHRGLSKADERVLSRHKQKIETVASTNYKHTEKRKLLTQKGGFIGALLPILGTLVTSFLTK